MLIPFATQSYRSSSLPISAQRALNCYAEREPPDTKTPVALFGAPGILSFATCGNGPIRAMRGMNGLLYAVSGSDLYSVTSAGVATKIGSIGSATDPVTLSDNGQQLFILNKAGHLYRLQNITSLNQNAKAGDTALVVLFSYSVAAMQSGDPITVALDNGTTFSGATLTQAPVQATINITPALTGDASLGNLVTDNLSTSTASSLLVVKAAQGDSLVYVDTIDGFQANDPITIALDGGLTYSGRIQSVVAGPTLRISAGLPSAASLGALVTDTKATLSLIADPGFFAASSITFFDDYFVFSRDGTSQFFLSALSDGSTFPTVYLASARVSPDNVVAVLADHEMLLVFGESSIETWYDAGSANFPLQRYDGATIERGCAAGLTPIKEDNAVFFLGDDLIFYRLQSTILQRVSTHAIEQAWRGYSTVADAFTFSYTFGGHKFVVVTFPTANATWVFDISSSYWHERDSLDATLASTGRWRGNCVATIFGKVLVGDLNSGQIGILDSSTFTEFGRVFQVQAVSPPIRQDRKRIFMPRFELEIEAGIGLPVTTSPILYLAAPLPGSAAAGNQVIDLTADPSVPDFHTALASAAAAAATQVSVTSVADIGLGDAIAIFLDNGPPFTTTVSFIADPANPKIHLDISKDGGHTFSAPRLPRSMGASGEYLTRLRWLRLGQARQRYMRITMLDPVKRVVVAAYADTFVGT